MCITFVVFTDSELPTRTITRYPGSAEATEYGLTRGTRFVANLLEVVAVAGLMWVLWCVLLGGFFRRPRAVSVDSVKGLRQTANLPSENSRPPITNRYTV